MTDDDMKAIEDAKDEPYDVSPAEMDMPSLSRISEERILAILGVPPVIAGIRTSSPSSARLT